MLKLDPLDPCDPSTTTSLLEVTVNPRTSRLTLSWTVWTDGFDLDDLRWLLIPDLSQCHYLKTLALRSIGSLGDLTFGAKEERCHAAWIWLVDLTKSVAAANSVTEALFELDPVLLAEPYAIISLGMSVQYDWMVLSDALNRFAPLASVTVLAPLKKGKAAKTCKAAKGVWTRSGRR